MRIPEMSMLEGIVLLNVRQEGRKMLLSVMSKVLVIMGGEMA